MSITSAVLIEALGIDAVGGGLLFGAIVGVGYLFANTVNIAINRSSAAIPVRRRRPPGR